MLDLDITDEHKQKLVDMKIEIKKQYAYLCELPLAQVNAICEDYIINLKYDPIEFEGLVFI